MSAKQMSLEAYAVATGGRHDGHVQGAIHAGLRSLDTKAKQKRWKAHVKREQVARDATREAYRAEVDAGRLAPPPGATTEEIAGYRYALTQAAAAQRILIKREMRKMGTADLGAVILVSCLLAGLTGQLDLTEWTRAFFGCSHEG